MNIPHIAHQQWSENFDLIPSFGRYMNGRLRFQLYMTDGQPFATISVNLANDQVFTDTEMFIKDYSENEEIVAALIEAGWITLTDRTVRSGHVTIPVGRLSGVLLDWYNTLTPEEVQ